METGDVMTDEAAPEVARELMDQRFEMADGGLLPVCSKGRKCSPLRGLRRFLGRRAVGLDIPFSFDGGAW